MRFLGLAILAMGMVSAAGQARAQTYDPNFPVCLTAVSRGGTYEDCSYLTLGQCAISASGRGGLCHINAYYAGAAISPPRNKRRPRHSY
jgi:hypothetical protein